MNESEGDPVIGLIDGSEPSTNGRFSVVLSDDAVVQLDDLVGTRQVLPDGREVSHYGIVVEGYAEIEGADLPSDTRRITAERTMPGETSRTGRRAGPADDARDVAAAGSRRRCRARERRCPRIAALFVDQMEHPLALGPGCRRASPVFADFSFINGEQGGHISISGISGVATKTSYALFVLYMLFETPRRPCPPRRPRAEHEGAGLQRQGRGPPPPRPAEQQIRRHRRRARGMGRTRRRGSRAVPLGSLLFASFGGRSRRLERDRCRVPRCARTCGRSDGPRSGSSARVCCATASPRRRMRGPRSRSSNSGSGSSSARHAHPLDGEPGAVVLVPPPPGTTYDFARLLRTRPDTLSQPAPAIPVRDFGDLVDFLTSRLTPPNVDPDWSAGRRGGHLPRIPAPPLRRCAAPGPPRAAAAWRRSSWPSR